VRTGRLGKSLGKGVGNRVGSVGKGFGKVANRHSVAARGRWDAGPGRGLPDGGLELLAAPPGLCGFLGPVSMEGGQFGVVLARPGLQHGGLHDVHPLGRGQGAAEEFLVFGDLRAGLGIYLCGALAPQRKQFLGHSENLGLTMLITLSKCHS
jgi:hypothetical protein